MALGQGEQNTGKQPATSASATREPSETNHNQPPTLSLPTGGGAISGMGEKFAANPVTGTGSLTVPIAASPGRSGFGPQLSLSYDSGTGNGPFGFGWSLDLPSITRKTDKGLPRYQDGDESDVFLISGAEDLVPILDTAGKRMALPRTLYGVAYMVYLYRPRIEGLFARIERWTRIDNGISHWRSISRDNVTTLFGFDENSRITDPYDPRHVFSYLIDLTFDDKGNATRYVYIAEDSTGLNQATAHEANRASTDRQSQRYLKRVLYGNAQPYFPAWSPDGIETSLPTDWHFQIVLDYGDHQANAPMPTPDLAWSQRPDPFSNYRAGFEVRTYRRCERVLLFHSFPEEAGVGADCLVRSTDFRYSDETIPVDPRNPIYTFMESVTQVGYRRNVENGYDQRSLPALEFFYSQAEVHPEILTLTDADSRANFPEGLDGSAFQWIDLDGEGLAGILTEQNGGWAYKRNLSPMNQVTLPDGERVARGRFGPPERVPLLPVPADLGSGQQLLDLSGGGRLALVALDGSHPGFFKHTANSAWEPFLTFPSLPRLNWSEPNLRFVDLTGDGRADVLITEDDVYTFYQSLGEDGFGEAQRVLTPWDEERGPRVVFADGTQTVTLADLSGDGLSDIVRMRNGEVCYWPNLGYGRFGAKVTMDDAPRFTDEESFDPRRVRWADVDGSGTTDLLYIGNNGVQVCFNRSGNSWAAPHQLAVFPSVDALSSVQVVDLLGNGTACLVWSSPLPGESSMPLRYVDLMGSQKPHLMVRTRNNLGAETRLSYAPSTRFYLEDKMAGRPWITRLPFPVHVVERVATYDWIGRSRFVTRYAYHHGYFDGEEREFRGFGMVEQWDTEIHQDTTLFSDVEATNEDTTSFVPPTHTRTWFHTGAFAEAGSVSQQYKHEYWVEPDLRGDAPSAVAAREALLLPDTIVETGLDPDAVREAYRALKGSPLRIEVYSEDGTLQAEHPYTVTEQNFKVRLLQAHGPNQHGVFFIHPSESIVYHYERNPSDPRISHALTLDVDQFGNVLQSVAIGYGRRQTDPTLEVPDQARQGQVLITYTQNDVTNSIELNDAYHTPLSCGSHTYELTGYVPTDAAGRFQQSDFVQQSPNGLTLTFDSEIQYEEKSANGRQRRLIEQMRTYYRPDDLGTAQNTPLALLPLGHLESLALPGESYRLAFTPGLLANVYLRDHSNQPSENLLPTPASILPVDVPGGQATDRGGYVDLDNDNHWWIPSGRVFYSPLTTHTPLQERTFARTHFFQPHRYRDPFHTNAVNTETFVSYDNYDLLVVETRDASDNVVTVKTQDEHGNSGIRIDYRVLQPYWVTDPNGNRTRVSFDISGMIVGTAVMGKPLPAAIEGDSLDNFDTDLTEAAILDHLANPLADPQAILQQATTRLVYDLFAYDRTKEQANPQPVTVYTLVRETHAANLGSNQQAKIQHSFSYSDGFGREIQKKMQAESGPVPMRDATGKIIVGTDNVPEMTPNAISPRWVGSGWTIFNNRGKPVRQYEPFFTDTHLFEFEIKIGVSPVLFYDPVERVVATLHPNHTWEKVVFDPWRQETWDVTDTALVADPKTDADVGNFFLRLPDADYLPTWYAQRQGGVLGVQEQDAARKAAIHAATPTLAHVDSLGRTFLTVAHNKFKYSDTPIADPPVEEFHQTRIMFDIEGNQREVIDGRDRIVMRYDYDMLGNRLHQTSMEAGERWTLNDVTGKPIRAWDSRNHQFRSSYDQLRRPVASFLREGPGPEHLIGRTIYGETLPDPVANNLRGKAVQLFDQAGVVTSSKYDFKGNLLTGQRQLVQEYKLTIDWATNPGLEPETFTSSTIYDALNRPLSVTAPDQSVYRPTFNEANLLEKMEVNLRGAQLATAFVANIDYDAKGQRILIEYGNHIRTGYTYDPLTFRLINLKTTRLTDQTHLQDLSYTYDPVGNITQIQDDAQQTTYFNNQVVTPRNDYTYDALYRLIEAHGREHVGQATQPQTTWNDQARVQLPHPGDGQAMRLYTERYEYDAVGNFLHLLHQSTNGNWTRGYTYNEQSLIEAGQQSNRLSSTTIGSNNPVNESYAYDAHGNMTSMPHLTLMQWDYKNELQATARQVVSNGMPETTYYVYDASGQRVRKITERQNGTRKNERIYLGAFEVYREYDGNGTSVTLERESLHSMDDTQRIALVETRTLGHDGSPGQLIRYQFGNHLGSASLELDDAGQIISYEEYYPHGSTSYQAGRSVAEVSLKRYRYTGMERDEETGFAYHGARYYAMWLGRWVSADPIGVEGGINLYVYVESNPINSIDATGTDSRSTSFDEFKRSKEWRAYVRAAKDLEASNARMAEFKKTKEYASLMKLDAAKANLDQVLKERAEKQRELVAAQAQAATARERAKQAIERAEQSAIKAKEAAESARFWTRIAAGLQAIGHSLEAAVACPLAETGIGAVGCIHATTSLYADAQTLSSGGQTPNLFHQTGYGVAKLAGAGDKTANIVGGFTDVAGGGASAYVSLSSSALTLETVGESSMQRVLVGTGTRSQFRADVLAAIRSDPNHPLRFLLDDNSSSGFKQLISRAHANLADNPDIWEAGHIMSDKLGGERLMIQSAFENQVQNQTIERFAGFGVLDNPAIDIGNIAVARSTASWWEDLGWLARGTVARAQVVQ